MMIPSVSCLHSVPEAERARAMDCFRMLQPFLEEDVPLTHVARRHGLPLRTARRWVMLYHKHGLAGLCRKDYAGKGQHRLSSDLHPDHRVALSLLITAPTTICFSSGR